jgi:hypothetical protein
MKPLSLANELENMTEIEAFDLLDRLTTPPVARI